MTESAPDPPAAPVVVSPPDAEGIAHHPRCTACEYLLLGLPPEGVCPECGQPIVKSMQAYRAAEACPDWMTNLRAAADCTVSGLGILVAAAAVTFLAILLALVAVPLGALAGVAAFVLAVGGAGTVLIGTISLTTRSTDDRLPASAERARVAARRACAAAWVCLPFVAVTCSVPPLIASMLLASVLCGLTWLAFHSLYLARLAKTWNWSDVQRTATRSRLSILVLVASLLMTTAVVVALSSVPVGARERVLETALWVTAGAAALAALLSLIAFARLHLHLRRRLRQVRSATASQAPKAPSAPAT